MARGGSKVGLIMMICTRGLQMSLMNAMMRLPMKIIEYLITLAFEEV